VFIFLEPRSFFGQQIPPRDPNFQAGLFAGPSEDVFTKSTLLDYPHELYGLYVQDQWKIRPNFTLTLGVRYDLEVLPTAEETKTQGRFHATDYNNIQPRISFAYSFNNGRGVLRGGYGLFTSPFVFSDIQVSWIGASEFTFMNQPLQPHFTDPQNNLIGFGDSGAVGPIPVAIPGLPCPLPDQAFSDFTATGAYPPPQCLLQFPLGYAQRKFPNPYAQQASLQLERQLGNDFFVSAGYQYLHGIKLPMYLSINPFSFLEARSLGKVIDRPTVDILVLHVGIDPQIGQCWKANKTVFFEKALAQSEQDFFTSPTKTNE